MKYTVVVTKRGGALRRAANLLSEVLTGICVLFILALIVL